MAEIPAVGHNNSVGPIGRVAGSIPYSGPPRDRQFAETRPDRVELSEHARLLDRLRQMPDVRNELVSTVRHAIADGSYETPEKLDGAVAQLLDDLR